MAFKKYSYQIFFFDGLKKDHGIAYIARNPQDIVSGLFCDLAVEKRSVQTF